MPCFCLGDALLSLASRQVYLNFDDSVTEL